MNGWVVKEYMRKTVVFESIEELLKFLRWRLGKDEEWQKLPEDYQTGGYK